ncbi:MAG: hypothetical protein LBE84_11045 [Planctomycetota bacterium]|jgi:hypothetical protein|nr:hypothetical protein [Planctomycetota bacterium]
MMGDGMEKMRNGGEWRMPAKEDAAEAEAAGAAQRARFLAARSRPRSFDRVRERLLACCRRVRFAEAARYRKPAGEGFVEGPSLRFADEAVKILGNIETRQEPCYEDGERRLVRVSVTDLESNLTKSDTVVIEKIVERKTPRKGREMIGDCGNSGGGTAHFVRASDDEILNREGYLCAKKRRNLELQLIPQDLLDECMDEAAATMRRQDAENPEAARRRLLDSFAALGVAPADLGAYLGHEAAACSPAERQSLREIYAAVRDGQAAWTDIAARNGGTRRNETDSRIALQAGAAAGRQPAGPVSIARSGKRREI